LYRRLPKFGFTSLKQQVTAEVRLSEIAHVELKPGGPADRGQSAAPQFAVVQELRRRRTTFLHRRQNHAAQYSQHSIHRLSRGTICPDERGTVCRYSLLFTQSAPA